MSKSNSLLTPLVKPVKIFDVDLSWNILVANRKYSDRYNLFLSTSEVSVVTNNIIEVIPSKFKKTKLNMILLHL